MYLAGPVWDAFHMKYVLLHISQRKLLNSAPSEVLRALGQKLIPHSVLQGLHSTADLLLLCHILTALTPPSSHQSQSQSLVEGLASPVRPSSSSSRKSIHRWRPSDNFKKFTSSLTSHLYSSLLISRGLDTSTMLKDSFLAWYTILLREY